MKKLMAHLVLVVFFLSVCSIAFARTDKGIIITGVGCGDSGTCYANVATPVGPTMCVNRSQVRWNGESTVGKNFTAAFLTAKAADFTVNIGTIDGECAGNFPKLNFVTVVY